MIDIVECFDKYQNITEVYEVVEAAEVVKDGMDRYRIEAVKRYHGDDVYYTAIGWRYDYKPGGTCNLIRYEIPWQHAPSADFALWRAINYLSTGDI